MKFNFVFRWPHDSAGLLTRAFLCSELWARVRRRAPALYRHAGNNYAMPILRCGDEQKI